MAGIQVRVVDLINELYAGSVCNVPVYNKVIETFVIKMCARQGCIHTPGLFNVVVDHTVQTTVMDLRSDFCCGKCSLPPLTTQTIC